MTNSIFTVATVLFEGADALARTVPSWIRSLEGTGVGCRFIDNSISDNTEALIRSLDWGTVEYSYERHATNPGFASSANVAVSGASTPWVFLLNPDVYLEPDHVEALTAQALRLSASDDQSPTAISLVTNGEHTCGISMDKLGYFSDRPSDSRAPCLGPSGGAALFHAETFSKLGGFDEDLFAWGEDAGLAVRSYAAGIRTHLLLLELEHEGGHSVASPAGQRFKAALLSRNRILVIRRDFSRPFAVTVGTAQLGVILANGVRKVFLGTAKQHFRGIRDGLRAPRFARRNSARMTLTQFVRYHARD